MYYYAYLIIYCIPGEWHFTKYIEQEKKHYGKNEKEKS